MKTFLYWATLLGIYALCIAGTEDEASSTASRDSYSKLLSTETESVLKPRALSSPRKKCSTDESCTKSCIARKRDYGHCINRSCSCDDYPASIKRLLRESKAASRKSGTRSPRRISSPRSGKASVSKSPKRSVSPKRRPNNKRKGSSTTPRSGSRSSRTPPSRKAQKYKRPAKGFSKVRSKAGPFKKRTGRKTPRTPTRARKSNGKKGTKKGGSKRKRKPVRPKRKPSIKRPKTPPSKPNRSEKSGKKGPSKTTAPETRYRPGTQSGNPPTLPHALSMGDDKDEEVAKAGIDSGISTMGATQHINSGKSSNKHQVDDAFDGHNEAEDTLAQSQIAIAGKEKQKTGSGKMENTKTGGKSKPELPEQGARFGGEDSQNENEDENETETEDDDSMFGMPKIKPGTGAGEQGKKSPNDAQMSDEFETSDDGLMTEDGENKLPEDGEDGDDDESMQSPPSSKDKGLAKPHTGSGEQSKKSPAALRMSEELEPGDDGLAAEDGQLPEDGEDEDESTQNPPSKVKGPSKPGTGAGEQNKKLSASAQMSDEFDASEDGESQLPEDGEGMNGIDGDEDEQENMEKLPSSKDNGLSKNGKLTDSGEDGFVSENGGSKAPKAGDGMNSFGMEDDESELKQGLPKSQNNSSQKNTQQSDDDDDDDDEEEEDMFSSGSGQNKLPKAGELPMEGQFSDMPDEEPFGPDGTNPDEDIGGNKAGKGLMNTGLNDETDDDEYNSPMKQMRKPPSSMNNNFDSVDDNEMGDTSYDSMGQMSSQGSSFYGGGLGADSDDQMDFESTMGQVPSEEPTTPSDIKEPPSVKKSNPAAEEDTDSISLRNQRRNEETVSSKNPTTGSVRSGDVVSSAPKIGQPAFNENDDGDDDDKDADYSRVLSSESKGFKSLQPTNFDF